MAVFPFIVGVVVGYAIYQVVTKERGESTGVPQSEIEKALSKMKR